MVSPLATIAAIESIKAVIELSRNSLKNDRRCETLWVSLAFVLLRNHYTPCDELDTSQGVGQHFGSSRGA